jgi:hypothetical protein
MTTLPGWVGGEVATMYSSVAGNLNVVPALIGSIRVQ